jgi:predicted helicase
LTEGMQPEFSSLLPMGTKEAKLSRTGRAETIFKTYSLGISSNRDDIVYDFGRQNLARGAVQFIENYNAEVSRWVRAGKPKAIDDFVRYEGIS